MPFIHKNALPHDKFAAILDLQNEAHVKKLRNAAAGFEIYRVLFPDKRCR